MSNSSKTSPVKRAFEMRKGITFKIPINNNLYQIYNIFYQR